MGYGLRSASILLCLLYLSVPVARSYEDEEGKLENAIRLLEHLSQMRRGLSSLRTVIDNIDGDLQDRQKRTCAVGGGMSHHCAAALLDSQLVAADWLKSGYSPGKRTVGSSYSAAGRSGAGADTDLNRKRFGASCAIGLGMPGYQCHLSTLHDEGKAKTWLQTSRLSPGKRTPEDIARKVKDVQHKRKGLDILKRIVDQMDTDLITEQKRTCAVNLGGHCATESAASLADQWHYLNSPLSPGRKRRDTGLFKKLIKGELFQ